MKLFKTNFFLLVQKLFKDTGFHCIISYLVFEKLKKFLIDVSFFQQPGSCADKCSQLEVGQTIHKVNEISLENLLHEIIVFTIANEFTNTEKDFLQFVVSEN